MYLQRNSVDDRGKVRTYLTIAANLWLNSNGLPLLEIRLDLLRFGLQDKVNMVRAEALLEAFVQAHSDFGLSSRDNKRKAILTLRCLQEVQSPVREKLVAWSKSKRTGLNTRYLNAQVHELFSKAIELRKEVLFRIVSAVWRNPMSIGELARQTRYTHGMLTIALEYLEDAGFPILEPSFHDDNDGWKVVTPRRPTRAMIRRWDS